MRIELNAQPLDVADGLLLKDLLQERGMDPRLLALDVNGRYVGRKSLATLQLRDGDQVWAFPVGGGG